MRLGAHSEYHARRILEVRGLTSDAKTSAIQEYIAKIAKHRSRDIDQDIFSEMQHVLVMCPDGFKRLREARTISQIICVHYLFRRSIQDSVKKRPKKRHVSLKLSHTRLRGSSGNKKVLSLFVGMNLLNDNELFDEKHILRAVCKYILCIK